MPYADLVKRAEKNKEYLKKHYQKNKQYYSDKAKRYKKDNFALINKYKEKPCIDCGTSYPYYVMDFDHLRDKEFEIAKKANHGMSFKSLLTEISKCDLVCSNCHRERTHQRILQGG